MAEFLRLKKSECKNCYKCIRHCPVKSIRFTGNQAHIIGNECILCGQCFVVCPQNAKEIADGVEKAKVLIDSGSPVYVSLAPSFIANYNNVGIDNMRCALMQLGFAGAEETAIGATVVKKEYERMLKENNKDVVISSCCHSVNLLIQKYFPHLLPYLADVKSPMQAHAELIKREHPDAKVVFVGPCVAKKDEAEHYNDIVDAVLTFEELTNWFERENIELNVGVDNTDESLARFFPTTGGVLKTMTERNPVYTYLAIDGAENCIAALKDIEQGKIHRCFIEMSTCVGSCSNGPVMEKYHNSPVKNQLSVIDYAGDADFSVEQPEPDTLHKEFEMIEKHLATPSEMEIAEVLRKMGKTSKGDELNCGSCGYNTCREKAIAILQGKAELSSCLPYLKERAETLADNIMNNSPNGIIMLNENLEVQKINNVALSLVNLRRPQDVMGEPIVRILDPGAFLIAMQKGSYTAEKVYLAEYNRYVDETITYDKNYHTLLCTMRDVTDAERIREQRENINRQTVETADKVVEKQMRIVQEIASLLGETAAETKIALTKLKESIADE